MNAFVRSFAIAVAFGATLSAASAQSAQSVPPSRGAGDGRPASVTTTPAVRATDTMLEYRNADPLHGIYEQKPVFPQCADHSVVGPMPDAGAGTLAAEPLYNFMTDFDMPGIPCRKPL